MLSLRHERSRGHEAPFREASAMKAAEDLPKEVDLHLHSLLVLCFLTSSTYTLHDF